MLCSTAVSAGGSPGATTGGLAATGFKHAHAVAGGIFALLATDHVWRRRKAL